MKLKKILSVLLIATMLSTIMTTTASAEESSTTTINGTALAGIIYVATTNMATHSINPNATDGNYFDSSTISIVNNSTFPIEIEISDVTPTDTMTDVLPYEITGGNIGMTDAELKELWYDLGKTKSESQIAIGLTNITESSTWRNQIRTSDIYIKEMLNQFASTPGSTIGLGSINGGESVVYTLTGYHGLAFSQVVNSTNILSIRYLIAD